ncbi:PHP domain-containing protein [Streptosporangium carneum]|uniref:PHP domain-containing protein n=1 Tax=Streptosporangium carneum TaxID=47481 RepID=A0A9W6IBC8_9ACTN|nr:hypothetical protein [Streptosporangium carneum]GLK14360.1 hypothetical protein GCM10017600_77720 [Streptosporangium carneum]
MKVSAVAHVHSEWSDDGSWPLARLARLFRRQGVGVVLTSEHSRGFSAAKWEEYRQACAEASAPGLLFVPGIEYGDAENLIHVPVWGEGLPFLGDGLHTGHLLKEVAEAGGTAVLAHPHRRDAWSRFDPDWVPLLTAVEVWNRKYDGIVANPESLRLAREAGLPGFATLDFHNRRQIFPLTMRLSLGSPPTTSAVYAALAARRFEARAFGVPVRHLAGGPGGQVMRGLETARRRVAPLLRRLFP